MIWLRRARLRRARRIAEWAVVIVLGAITLFAWFCIGALLNYALGMGIQQAPAAGQIAYWRAWTALALIENVPFITAEIPSPPPLIPVHDDLAWPAEFKSASGIPCCTLNAGMGDCVRVSRETAMSLRIGSTIALDFPAGYRVVRINVIHSGPEPVVCATGCLFSQGGV